MHPVFNISAFHRSKTQTMSVSENFVLPGLKQQIEAEPQEMSKFIDDEAGCDSSDGEEEDIDNPEESEACYIEDFDVCVKGVFGDQSEDYSEARDWEKFKEIASKYAVAAEEPIVPYTYAICWQFATWLQLKGKEVNPNLWESMDVFKVNNKSLFEQGKLDRWPTNKRSKSQKGGSNKRRKTAFNFARTSKVIDSDSEEEIEEEGVVASEFLKAQKLPAELQCALQEAAKAKDLNAIKSEKFKGEFLFDENTLKSVLSAVAIRFLRDEYKPRRNTSRGRSPVVVVDDDPVEFDVDERVSWSEHVIPRDDLVMAIENADDYAQILRRLGCSDGTAEEAVNKITMKCGARAHSKARRSGNKIPKDEEEKSIYLTKDLPSMREIFKAVLKAFKINGIEPIEEEEEYGYKA